jgi:AsmA protein
MIKKIVIVVGVLVLLIVAALVALATLVDVDRFKPQIAVLVKNKLHRTLSIDGKLSLAVFPRIAVELPQTRLSNLGGTQDAASLDSARIAVALLPLLSGRIEADTIRIDGLKATLERRADGSTSIDDLIGGGARKPPEAAGGAASPPASAGSGSGPPPFEIGGLQLTRAELTFNDRQAGASYTLAPLDLKTGRLANVAHTPVDLTVHLTATKPAVAGDLTLKGTLDIDLDHGTFGAADLDAKLKGTLANQPVAATIKAGKLAYDSAHGEASVEKLDAQANGTFGALVLESARVVAPALAYDPVRKTLAVGGLDASAKGQTGGNPFEATLAAPKIEASANAASGEQVRATVKLGGAEKIDATLLIETLGGTLNQMTIGKLSVKSEVHQGARTIAATLDSPATASLENQALALTRLDAAIEIDDPDLPQKTIKIPVTGLVAVDNSKQTANAKLFAAVDQSKLELSADVKGFAKPHADFDADIDRIDLDRYLPPAPKPGAAPPPAPAEATAQTAQTKGGASGADPKLDLSALKALDLEGQVKVGALKARGLQTSNLRIGIKASGGRIDVAPITAALYGGTLNANAGVVADGNRIAAKAALAGVAIGPLLKDMIEREPVDGHGNVNLDLTTSGPTVGALRLGLNGTASIALRDGAIKGVNVAQRIRDGQSLLNLGGTTESKPANDAEQTDFSELGASYAVHDGIATSTDIDAKSPLVRVGGTSTIDLVQQTIDTTLQVSIVGTLTGQSGKQLSDLHGVTVPVHLTGPFDEVAYTIDWRNIATQLAKSKASDALKSAVATPEQRDKLRSQAQQALKGLLGGSKP